MPAAKAGHCQLTINSTHIFITGYSGTEAFILDWENQDWFMVDDIPVVELRPSCGFLESSQFGSEILVAVGRYSYIFSLTNLIWRDGPALPQLTVNLGYAQVSGGFLAIGGDVNGSLQDTVYKFSEDSYEWKLLENSKLEVPKSLVAAVAVPDEFLNCA